MLKLKYLLACWTAVYAITADAVEYQTNTWDVGISANRFVFEDDENSILGNSGMFHVGRSWIGDRWRFNGTVDIIMGPYGEIRDERVKTDFFGTGVTASAYCAINGSIRKSGGSWGLSAGANYFDIVGRSVQNGRTDDENEVITNLTMRVTNFMVMAGVFHAWMEKQRPVGNTPDLLLTRVEGYMIGVSGAYPLQSSYGITYDKRSQGPAGPTGPTTTSKDRGALHGYAFLATFSAMLGY